MEQLDDKLRSFKDARGVVLPQDGWIRTIRTTINMTLEQLGKKLGITKQGARKIEGSEQAGSITIKALDEVGEAMDMKFVYGFVPKDGSFQRLIDKKARELATKIVERAHHNMVMEDQANSDYRIDKSIDDLADELKKDLDRTIWD